MAKLNTRMSPPTNPREGSTGRDGSDEGAGRGTEIESTRRNASDKGSRSVSRRSQNSSRAARHHVPFDIAGVVFFTLAVLSIIALVSSDSGVIGSAMKSLFSNLFGKGAWVVPAAFTVLGLGYIRGFAKAGRVWFGVGIGMVFVTILGLLAQANAGDYFDPASAAASGGYIGAIFGWAFQSLFGVGKAVGLVALGLIGFVLAADKPLKQVLESVKNRAKLPIREEVAEEEAPKKPKRAVVGLQDDDLRSRALPKGLFEEPEPTAPEPAPKPKPIIRDQATSEPKERPLSVDIPVPKEGYQLPPITLLAEPQGSVKRSPQEVQKNIETIEGTLEQFGIEANVVEVAAGPTITRFEIQLGPGIRVARIVSLADNIAMDMAASQVRVEAPIPGKAAIGLEIPNATRSMVSIRELCESKEFMEHPSRLCVALGKDVSGVNRYADLTKMPHLLIAGATNSGKSIGLATLITSLLIRNTPKDVRLVMIDPKRVELTLFDQIPHLMCPVIKDVKEAPGVLRAVWREMDRRYDLLSEHGVRNIDGWNAKASFQDKLPYIVVIIDELADLMIQAKAEVETSIVRLAQLARAVGIHLVIATQRPSVDVITGTIKANIPSRVAFAVASQIDSRTILDAKGAEALIGRGDMLYAPIDANKPMRIQGCYVSEKEIEEICEFWRKQESPIYSIDPSEFDVAEPKKEAGDFGEDLDPLWEEVVRFVVERGQVSTSMIQRRFSIGFQRASRLLDSMQERQIIGPPNGPRPREVLVSLAELDTIFGGGEGVARYDLSGNIDDYGDEDTL